MKTETHTPARFIRAKEGAARFGVSVGTWWNWNNPKSRHYRPDFPKPIKIAPNATGWLESEIAAYIDKLRPLQNLPKSPKFSLNRI